MSFDLTVFKYNAAPAADSTKHPVREDGRQDYFSCAMFTRGLLLLDEFRVTILLGQHHITVDNVALPDGTPISWTPANVTTMIAKVQKLSGINAMQFNNACWHIYSTKEVTADPASDDFAQGDPVPPADVKREKVEA